MAMLELKNVSVGYGDIPVLDGVSVAFEKGKLTGIIGVNGSGKSTLLKAMLGILPMSDGEIMMDGRSLRDMGRNEIAKKAAYLAQGKSTPDMTVEQMVLHGRFPHLAYPRRYTKADLQMAKMAMDAVGISYLAEKPLCALSGGMRQNAYIAMALAQDTDWILLDEPTAYLDIAHQIELMRMLKKLAKMGKGVIAVMHDLPLAFDFSDEIAVIHDRKVVACSTPIEICRSSLPMEIFGVRMERREDNKFYCNY